MHSTLPRSFRRAHTPPPHIYKYIYFFFDGEENKNKAKIFHPPSNGRRPEVVSMSSLAENERRFLPLLPLLSDFCVLCFFFFFL